MRHTIAITLACASMIGLAATASFSAAGPTTRTVYVTVVDDNGRAVDGLTPRDFVVKEGGKLREIFSVAPATERMRLALMVEYPLVGQSFVRFGLAEFVARMCASADVALFMITQRPERLVDFTSNASILIDTIVNLPLSQPRLSAAVPDAIYDVAQQFEKRKPARPVIVLATIEQGQTTEADPESVLSQIAKSKAQFWTVSIEPSRSQPSGKAASLRDFAGRTQIIGDGPTQSGGRRVAIMTLPAFETGLKQVADDLSSQYLITYLLPSGVRPSDRINVSLKKPGLTLRAPSRVPK
jgi:VWFA-related protein